MPPEATRNNAEEFGGLVVVVDPYSTGCLVAKEMAKRGYLLMALWTTGFSDAMKLHIPTSCGPINYLAEVDQAASLAETAEVVKAAAKDVKIAACIAGGEAGVDLADALSEYLKLRTNGTDIPNRRDKKIQQELIRKIGLRSVNQSCGKTFEEVEPFLKVEQYPLVLKPVESAGSDGVKLCQNFQEAKDHFELLMKSQMVNGGECPAVLCQEFLRGKEYVVDHVSRDGIHKTMMVWVYDKRPANGSAFVYYGCVPVDSNSEEAKILIPYVRDVLDAMGLKNGPSHGEVMMTSEGPCLIEMNCRAHGGDGNWRPLCRALTGGYSQVEAAADAYLDPFQFQRLPDKPPSPFRAAGQECILVSYSRGIVKSCPGYDVMKALPSFVCLETGIKKGSSVDYTIDLFTGIGSVILMHEDEKVLKRDLEFVRYLEEINGIFLYETKLENLNRPTTDAFHYGSVDDKPKDKLHRRVFSSDGPSLIRHFSNDRPELNMRPLTKRVTTVDASNECVVVIDPYSTGCLVAEEILKRGYTIICLWTEGFAPHMKSHVPLSVNKLTYHAEMDQEGDVPETAVALKKLAGNLRIVSVIAGGEAGVSLADALSEYMGVRTNGTEIPFKSDKQIQQELIKKRGLRSIRQAVGSTFAEVEPFLRREQYPVVLKPKESAGSDGVKLCHNFEEAKEHFKVLMEMEMVNGGDCGAVLCQEFLRGKEYVVDHVSRDGVHKTMMVWVYDKRPANGSAFVYFGCVPVDANSPEAKLLIPYARRVLDALQLKNGPSHGEFMMTNDGPCLIEMNPRAHGGDGNWRPLQRGLNGGYTQVDVTVDSYLDGRQFLITPSIYPSPFRAFGQEVILVSYSRGVVRASPGFEEIKKLQSFVLFETGIKEGSRVEYTVDLLTCLGSVILMHEDPDVVKHDTDRIRQIERENLFFEYEDGDVLLTSPSNVMDSHQTSAVTTSSPSRADLY